MKKIFLSIVLLFTLLSSHAQYMSFFGDSTWSYSMTYLDVEPSYYYEHNTPFEEMDLNLYPLGAHCQTFVYCFDRKDSVYYQQDNTGLSGLYYHGNRNCSLAEELLEYYPPKQSEIPEYILNHSEQTILKEDRETGRLYRDHYLICDMSLTEGDTFLLKGLCASALIGGEDNYWGDYFDTIIFKMLVDSVRYISGRKIINLSLLDHTDDYFFGTEGFGILTDYHFSIRFIEGIGPSYGIINKRCLYPNFWAVGTFGYLYKPNEILSLLQCVYKDDELVYTADDALNCNQTYYIGIEDYQSKPIMNVFPNPATEYVNIDFSTNEEMNGEVTVTDMLGGVCKTHHAYGQTCSIQVADMPVGVYILTYIDKNRTITRKFLKK